MFKRISLVMLSFLCIILLLGGCHAAPNDIENENGDGRGIEATLQEAANDRVPYSQETIPTTGVR